MTTTTTDQSVTTSALVGSVLLVCRCHRVITGASYAQPLQALAFHEPPPTTTNETMLDV